MEDRHSFSDPRPVPGLKLPTWEVDVFREGVEEPVLTLMIDETTLPPRMRKKKVVWRLPHSVDEVPSFGSDEKKRLLDLFKKEKKARRKSKLEELKPLNQGTEGGDAKSIIASQQHVPVETNGNGSVPLHSKTTNRAKLNSETLDPSPPPGLGMSQNACANGQPVKTNGNESVPMRSNGDALNGHSNPLTTNSAPPVPPPGFGTTLQPIEGKGQSGETNGSTDSGHAEPVDTAPPGFGMTSLSLEAQQPAFFVVPPLSTTVDLAKVIVDIYYPCIAHGHSDELARHYAHSAVKSLSVGGAHAVCSSRNDFLHQLQSLEHSQFQIKGVVAQQGFGDSVVLLITGSVENALTRLVLPFCHTMTLIRMDEGYQIHNDAMALLTA
jgi:hypothetical protein